ncbi:hypothetical protein [Iodidimonas sp. SYSU 1G8]|uniref:hypothetical protein n=1 Tax=Iodidimonas sp. SYSU 1G8 TaxID=3133967 RepID=UPI0031FEBB5F
MLPGGKLIADRGNAREIIRADDIVMTDDHVFWKQGPEFQFLPKKNRMTHTSGTGTDELTCARQ